MQCRDSKLGLHSARKILFVKLFNNMGPLLSPGIPPHGWQSRNPERGPCPPLISSLLLRPDSPGRRAADFRQVRDIVEVGTFGRVVADEALFLAHRGKLLPVLGMSPLRAMAGLTLDVLQHIR